MICIASKPAPTVIASRLTPTVDSVFTAFVTGTTPVGVSLLAIALVGVSLLAIALVE
jgi:hypothetical protein